MKVQGNVDDSLDMVWYNKGMIDNDGWSRGTENTSRGDASSRPSAACS
ncbi:MAG TPA: hypothetical protein VHP61_03530 [Acidobacteriota bacterium]|nr:hypothetical protein [Acidobacteriota bacterium]